MEILYKFPKSIHLSDGTELVIRPLRKDDQNMLHEYYLRLPSKEVARLKNDVTDPEVIENWIYDIDYDVDLPLIALDNDKIVASITLKFNPMGWTKHQGEIRGTVDTAYRKKGLFTILIENMIEIAQEKGLEQLTAEIPPSLQEAYFLFEKMGFKEVAVLKDFVKDQEGNYDDLVIMVKDIQ